MSIQSKTISISLVFECLKSNYLVLVFANSSGQISPSRTIFFTVPFERDSKFIGREDVITEINRKFEVQRRVALVGIGGVG